jgi:tRNA/rRNA methyltransferase|tara:strand:+ start:709 stop:1455 length:747 start_codon:yes stop_codon:yes gene_type:complete
MITVVLIEPHYSGNIGSVCRAMKNFGFTKLEMVNPKKITDEAGMMAVHAKDVLEKAKTLKKFNFKKFDYVIGTSCVATESDDYFLRMTVSLKQLKQKFGAPGRRGAAGPKRRSGSTALRPTGNIAIVFGPEPSGLSNEFLEQCDIIATIPTSTKYRSMNLSHSVAVALYELSDLKQESTVRLANSKEKTLINQNLSKIVKASGYPAEKHKVFNSMFQKLLGRAVVTGREANTLIGVLKRIRKALGVRP